MSEDKKVVSEKIDVLLLEGDKPINYQEFIDRLDELYKQHSHLSYEDYELRLERSKDLNGWALLFNGNRLETNEEQKLRVAQESAKRKTVEQAELKEYLRLKKKYGKKDS